MTPGKPQYRWSPRHSVLRPTDKSPGEGGGGPQTGVRQKVIWLHRVTIGDTKLCAGEGTRDTCNGDSGGGLFSRWVSHHVEPRNEEHPSGTLVGASQWWG